MKTAPQPIHLSVHAFPAPPFPILPAGVFAFWERHSPEWRLASIYRRSRYSHSHPSTFPLKTSQDLLFQPLADSFTSPKKSSPLESSKSRLFFQNTRGGGVSPKSPFWNQQDPDSFFPTCLRLGYSPAADHLNSVSAPSVPRGQIRGAERSLPPRHESDTAATEGSRGGRAALGEKCATCLSH